MRGEKHERAGAHLVSALELECFPRNEWVLCLELDAEGTEWYASKTKRPGCLLDWVSLEGVEGSLKAEGPKDSMDCEEGELDPGDPMAQQDQEEMEQMDLV